MRKLLALTLTITFFVSSAGAAVRGQTARYVGGTVGEIPVSMDGYLDFTDGAYLKFGFGNAVYGFPYRSINSIEFGQKIGRRVGSTIALGVTTIGLLAIPMLLSKKKRHFLTIEFTNYSGQQEAVVFELAKGIVSSVIPSIEARSGKKVVLDSSGIRP